MRKVGGRGSTKNCHQIWETLQIINTCAHLAEGGHFLGSTLHIIWYFYGVESGVHKLQENIPQLWTKHKLAPCHNITFLGRRKWVESIANCGESHCIVNMVKMQVCTVWPRGNTLTNTEKYFDKYWGNTLTNTEKYWAPFFLATTVIRCTALNKWMWYHWFNAFNSIIHA